MSRGKRRAEEELQPYAAASRQSSFAPGWGGGGSSAGNTVSSLPNRLPAGSDLKAVAGPPSSVRAATCLQHVRALNTQFLSWVQRQVAQHPDELWVEGVGDYTRHATKILAEFKDVVDWLKVQANGSAPAKQAQPQESKTPLVIPAKSTPPSVFSTLSHPATVGTTSFATAIDTSLGGTSSTSSFVSFSSGTAGTQDAREASKSQEPPTKKRTPGALSSLSGPSPSILPHLPASAWAGLTAPAPPGGGLFGAGAAGPGGKLLGGLAKPGGFGPTSAVSGGGSSGAGVFQGLAGSGSGLAGSGGGSSGSLFNWAMPSKVASPGTAVSPAPAAAVSSKATSDATAAIPSLAPVKVPGTSPAVKIEEVKDDQEEEKDEPSSPSFKKGMEPGVEVLHEVRAKLYVQHGQGDKKSWKDMGVGMLNLKRYPAPEGKSDSEPPVRIMFRTEVGRLLMNALLYTGIKATVTKKQVLLALFSVHEEAPAATTSTSPTQDGSPEKPRETNGTTPRGSPGNPARTTYLLRVGTEDVAKELSDKISEHAPKR